ncbi:hypothetical protein ACFQ9V_12460 [Leifsonia sp. NPDC056665]|uniref:hypothetical protein n=1 Tax=Leifsonia sp. NPDC056665 TaxID=3345901 RepID=UPI0036967B3D
MSRSRPSATFAVLALSVASFATLQSLVVPVLPVIQQDLHTTTAGVTWTMTAWLIAAAVATPLLGRVATWSASAGSSCSRCSPWHSAA